jgi:hypothetical protein
MDKFWAKKVLWKKQGDLGQAIINGNHYHFYPEDGMDVRGMGHGGRAFFIKFFDGRIVKTRNLLAQGHIDCPEARDILRDNAKFVYPIERPVKGDIDGIPF